MTVVAILLKSVMQIILVKFLSRIITLLTTFRLKFCAYSDQI